MPPALTRVFAVFMVRIIGSTGCVVCRVLNVEAINDLPYGHKYVSVVFVCKRVCSCFESLMTFQSVMTEKV